VDTHVISLDRTPDRLDRFMRVNSHLPWLNHLPGVDGALLRRDDHTVREIVEPDVPYPVGSIGCLLSHIAFWDLVIERDTPMTVCEDDAVFNRQFDRDSTQVINSLPADWHFCLWGYNFDAHLMFDFIPGVSVCLAQFDQNTMRAGIEQFRSAEVNPRAFRLIQASGTMAYSISPNGARMLREVCLPVRNTPVYFPGFRNWIPNVGPDVTLSAVYRNMLAFVCFPPLVLTPHDQFNSTIKYGAPDAEQSAPAS
jgi:glycosyl transferase family 25